MDHMDQTSAGGTASRFKRRHSRLAIVAVVALSVGVTGCSSKPGDSDIKTSLANEFQCPILEINDVKKTDGAELGNHSYQVSYSFEVALKGGSSAAQKLLPELAVLNERLERGRLQHDRAANIAAISGNPAPLAAFVDRATDEVMTVRKRLAEIQPCELPNARFAIERIRAAAIPTAPPPAEGIPVGLVMRGTSAMIKAESGWRFAEPPRFDINAEKVSRDSSVHMPQPSPLWTEFSQRDGAFIAKVPSAEQCNFVEADPKTGQRWWQCSFGTADTNMDVWFAKLSGTNANGSVDLDAKVKEIAERHNEQVSDLKPVKWGTVDAAEFTGKSTEGVRKVRLFVAGQYEVQAIASVVPGRKPNFSEMQQFTEGVKPMSMTD